MSSAYPSERFKSLDSRKIVPNINEGENPGKIFSNPMINEGFKSPNYNYSQQRRDSDAWNESNNRPTINTRNNNTSRNQSLPNVSANNNNTNQQRESIQSNQYTPPQHFEYESEASYYQRSPRLRHRLVPQANYIKVAQVFISECVKNKIDMNTPDKFKRLRLLHGTLANADLLTLLTGHRPKPV